MQSILVNTTRYESRRQINFLIGKELSFRYSKFRQPIFYLIGLTIVVVAFATLTPSELFVTLKVVVIFTITIGWVLLFILLCIVGYTCVQRIRWRNKRINNFFEGEASWSLAFDENKIILITSNYTSEMKWSYFKYYDEDELSVYIIPEKDLYATISISSREIDVQNFELLKTVVKLNLIPLAKR